MPGATLHQAFQEHERFLWGIGYRMLGSAAEADDLVQETFARALERPPVISDEQPLRPWLVTVAMNLARDLLRRRRRQAYVGPWLPSPIETGDPEPELAPHEPASSEGRYDLMESVSYAFLLALEVLSPPQRAVLLLRDVFDYTVDETAAALALSAGNVKTTHHRARKAMAAYDAERRPPSRELAAATRAAIEQLFMCLMTSDVAAAEKLLRADVRSLHDGGGEFTAARVPVVGAAKVLLFYTRTYAQWMARGRPPQVELRTLNGMPAIIISDPLAQPGEPTRSVFRVELGADGRVREMHNILATPKLQALR